MRTTFIIVSVVIFISLLFSCNTHNNKTSPHSQKNLIWCYDGISSLKKGDIIAKPNFNYLPGTSYVEDGFNFGHAVMVTQDYTHANIDSLLANVMVIESSSLDLPQGFQIREVQGYAIDNLNRRTNTSFGPEYQGSRYRLRMNLSEAQIDSIIAFMREQKLDFSNWNAMKRFPDSFQDTLPEGRKNWADNSHWYCSLLIWQAVYYVTGTDIDPNGGYFIYPNDLIKSPVFNNTVNERRRVRF